ncbi:MAG: homoserine kinase, partial [Pseudomonadota bacterium]
IAAKDGDVLRQIKRKPAAIVTFLEGTSPRRPNVEQCKGVGSALAEMHHATTKFSGYRPNNLSLDAWHELWSACQRSEDLLVRDLTSELSFELDTILSSWPKTLPHGIVHADLFPDNVFFRGNQLSGLIDFYFACNDITTYDLAICINAWCFEEGAEFNITKARALAGAYHQKRPLSRAELDALPILSRGACMRFLLTRLYDWVHAVDGALVEPKDPREYLSKLRFHRDVKGPGAYGFD